MDFKLKKLTEENFADFSKLTSCENKGGCYCSYWHQKWNSREDWDKQCHKNPEKNKMNMLEKVRAGFHIGVLAYLGNELVAWMSVGPLPEFYWTWRRVGQIGNDAAHTAGIICITLDEKFRNKGYQVHLLESLKGYAKTCGWKKLEGYPFDQSAIDQYGSDVFWPGFTSSFEKAGFKKEGPHWLNHPSAERSLYSFEF